MSTCLILNLPRIQELGQYIRGEAIRSLLLHCRRVGHNRAHSAGSVSPPRWLDRLSGALALHSPSKQLAGLTIAVRLGNQVAVKAAWAVGSNGTISLLAIVDWLLSLG